jgi:hypothetical protein
MNKYFAFNHRVFLRTKYIPIVCGVSLSFSKTIATYFNEVEQRSDRLSKLFIKHINACDNLSSIEMHHDVVFLDYYSFLRENILDEIKTFVGNDNIIHSDKPCILGITLSKGMRRDKDLTLDLLSEFRWKGHRTGTENNIEQVTEGIHGFLDISFNLTELEVLYTKQYEADDDKSATMYFILLKIVK